MSNHLVKNNLQLMTFKEVASVFNKDESTIRKIAKDLFPDIFVNGVKTYLTESQVTAIKLNLGNNSELAKTNLEKKLLIQQAIMFLNEEVEELKQLNSIQGQQLIEQAPKVQFFDTVTQQDGWLTFKELANILNIKELGRNNLTKKLRELKFINDFNKPYQRYIDQKLFKVIETNKSDKIFTSTVVSQKGLDRIIKELK